MQNQASEGSSTRGGSRTFNANVLRQINLKEVMKSALRLARIVIPIMCRLFGIVGILQGVAVLGFAAFLAVRSHQTTTPHGLALLVVIGIVSIAMGVVIFKWFTRFMLWNLQRCAKSWGLEQADR